MGLGSIAPYPLSTPNLIEGLILRSPDTITVPNVLGSVAAVVTVTPGVGTQEITNYKLKELTTGQTLSVTSDATPTATEVVALLISAFRANPILNGVATVSGTTTLVITERQKGLAYPQLSFVDGGSTPTNTLSVANTTPVSDPSVLPFGRAMTYGSSKATPDLISAALSGSNVFAGVTGFTEADIPSLVGGNNYLNSSNPGYPAYMACNLVRVGLVAVYSESAVDPTASVYTDTNAGVNQGRFSASSGSGLTQITNGVSWQSKTTSAGLAVLKVNLP